MVEMWRAIVLLAKFVVALATEKITGRSAILRPTSGPCWGIIHIRLPTTPVGGSVSQLDDGRINTYGDINRRKGLFAGKVMYSLPDVEGTYFIVATTSIGRQTYTCGTPSLVSGEPVNIKLKGNERVEIRVTNGSDHPIQIDAWIEGRYYN